MFLLQICDLLFDILPPLLILSFLRRVNLFNRLYPLSLDLMLCIELGEERRVDPVVTKLSVEEETSLF